MLRYPKWTDLNFLINWKLGGVSLKEVPIVMHTAAMRPEHKEKAETIYKEKLKGFVQKPLQAEFVKETISRVKRT